MSTRLIHPTHDRDPCRFVVVSSQMISSKQSWDCRQREVERVSNMSIRLIHPTHRLYPYRFVVDSSQMISSKQSRDNVQGDYWALSINFLVLPCPTDYTQYYLDP